MSFLILGFIITCHFNRCSERSPLPSILGQLRSISQWSYFLRVPALVLDSPSVPLAFLDFPPIIVHQYLPFTGDRHAGHSAYISTDPCMKPLRYHLTQGGKLGPRKLEVTHPRSYSRTRILTQVSQFWTFFRPFGLTLPSWAVFSCSDTGQVPDFLLWGSGLAPDPGHCWCIC